MHKIISMTIFLLILGLTLGFSPLWAHSPMFTCFDDGSGHITCEGSFSDGSTAAGNKVLIKDSQGNILTQGKLDSIGEYSFEKPSHKYEIIFDGGPGHQVNIKGSEVPEW
jgi:hypothetical protein